MNTIKELREEIKAIEQMTLAKACEAYNLNDEADRQDLLSDLRQELEYELDYEEELLSAPNAYDINELCPRLSGQFAF